jgi:uncharacterized protein involved in exopolysaccharide biosynthesis
LTHYWWLVLLTVTVATGSTAWLAQTQTPTYRTHTTLVVGPNESLTTPREIVDSLDTLDRRSVVATFAMLPSSRTVRDRTGQQLRLTDKQLAAYKVTTAVLPDTNVLEVSVEGPNPRFAAAFADAVAVQTIGYTREFSPIYGMKVLDRATVPSTTTEPNLFRRLLVGALLGLLIGVGAAFLLDRLRRHGSRTASATGEA